MVKKLNFILLAVIIFISIYLIFNGYMVGAFASQENFEVYIKQYGLLAPLIFILFQIVQVLVPLIPSFIGYAGGVALFGMWEGFFYNYIGITLGSILAFLLARRLGRNFVTSVVDETSYSKYMNWINKKKSFPIALFIVILLPFAPDDILCYLSGLTKISFRKFTWIIIFAKPWCILGYCLIFSGII